MKIPYRLKIYIINKPQRNFWRHLREWSKCVLLFFKTITSENFLTYPWYRCINHWWIKCPCLCKYCLKWDFLDLRYRWDYPSLWDSPNVSLSRQTSRTVPGVMEAPSSCWYARTSNSTKAHVHALSVARALRCPYLTRVMIGDVKYLWRQQQTKTNKPKWRYKVSLGGHSLRNEFELLFNKWWFNRCPIWRMIDNKEVGSVDTVSRQPFWFGSKPLKLQY